MARMHRDPVQGELGFGARHAFYAGWERNAFLAIDVASKSDELALALCDFQDLRSAHSRSDAGKTPMNNPLRALAPWRPCTFLNGVLHEPVDRLGPGKNRALRGAPIVERRQKFISGAHLKRSNLRLYHASSCVECVDIWLTLGNLRATS
jgi:hypothetical protein